MKKSQSTVVIVEQDVLNDQPEPASGPSVSRSFRTSFTETMISLLMWFWYFGQLISPFLLLTMAYLSWSSIICNLAAILLTGSYLWFTNTISKSTKEQGNLLAKYGFLTVYWSTMTLCSAILIRSCRKNPDAFSSNVARPYDCPSYFPLISLTFFTFTIDLFTYKILMVYAAYRDAPVANPRAITNDYESVPNPIRL